MRKIIQIYILLLSSSIIATLYQAHLSFTMESDLTLLYLWIGLDIFFVICIFVFRNIEIPKEFLEIDYVDLHIEWIRKYWYISVFLSIPFIWVAVKNEMLGIAGGLLFLFLGSFVLFTAYKRTSFFTDSPFYKIAKKSREQKKAAKIAYSYGLIYLIIGILLLIINLLIWYGFLNFALL